MANDIPGMNTPDLKDLDNLRVINSYEELNLVDPFSSIQEPEVDAKKPQKGKQGEKEKQAHHGGRRQVAYDKVYSDG